VEGRPVIDDWQGDSGGRASFEQIVLWMLDDRSGNEKQNADVYEDRRNA